MASIKRFWVIPLAALLCSCNMQNLKLDSEGIGTLAGGLLGGALGNAACDGKDQQELCTLVGLAAGAYIGNRIGHKLGEEDRKRHAQATAAALAAQEEQASKGWENPENGTSGSVTIVNKERKQVASQVPVLKDRVEAIMPLELIGELYQTDSRLNVRVGPGTDYKTAAQPLEPGAQFNVVGRVIEEPQWLLISQRGAATGYVYAPLVEPTGLAMANVPAREGDDIEQLAVNTLSTCKTVNHQITYDNGKTETETVEMCQRGDGSWDLV